MSQDLKGWVKARPLRIAFLVEESEHASLMLDGIFADCYSRWGGRFSLIVPCVNKKIPSPYWRWLEAYDPDIVYSYVGLSRTDILEIHERLCPAKYMFHDLGSEPRLDVYGFKPSYEFAPLSSLSLVFKMARYSPTTDSGASIKIIDSWHTETPTRFLTDNFGTYHTSRATGIYPVDASAAAGLLTIVSPERQANPRNGIPRDLDAVPDELTAFREFAQKKATSLSVASILFASKLDIRWGRWSEAFNLVVGESFLDRILFWNARLLIPAWLDNDLCCLRVNQTQLQEPEFLAVLGDLLKRRNHVNAGAGGQSQLVIRSTSLNTDQLNQIRNSLSSAGVWGMLGTEVVSNLDDLIPSVDALYVAREGDVFVGDLYPRPEWKRFFWERPTAKPPAATPNHLADAPARQVFTEGYWATDYIFELDSPKPRFGDINKWMLPRRWRMAGAFKVSMVGQVRFSVPPTARRCRQGNLAVFVCANAPVESIAVPTPYEAMCHALARDGGYADPEAEHGRVHPPNKVIWLDPSNEARYLTGVLGLAGGLTKAAQFFLHPFLQENFAKLGGAPSLALDKVVPTANRLKKRSSREATFDLKDESERLALADMIVKASRDLKNPMDFISYDTLKEGWKSYRETFWVAHPQQGTPDPNIDWDKHEASSLDACLIEMRQRKIMFQGHRWTCPKCHHRNWVDLSELASQLSCEVCKHWTQTPVGIPWLFRPNQFLIESLRDHSVLSLIWALSELRLKSRNSFMFVEPTWLGHSNQYTPDAEADLFVLSDGQAILCEIKSSWRCTRASHIKDFVDLAIRLRPDKALLAVMDKGNDLATALSDAQSRLNAEGVAFELLTLDSYTPPDDPYLPHDSEDDR